MTLTQTKMMTPDHILKVSKSESTVLMAYEVGDVKITLWGMCVVIRCEWGCSHLTGTPIHVYTFFTLYPTYTPPWAKV